MFGFGVAYAWLQTLISYRIRRAGLAGFEYVGCFIVVFRLTLCVLSTVMFLTGMLIIRIDVHVLFRAENVQSLWSVKHTSSSTTNVLL